MTPKSVRRSLFVGAVHHGVDGAFRENSIGRCSFSCAAHKKGPPFNSIVLLNCTMRYAPIIAYVLLGNSLGFC